MAVDRPLVVYFFFNGTATTEIYTLSLHDALPICEHITQFTTLIFTIEPWLQAVVHSRQACYVLQVRHERCTDDIVLILEVQGKITVVINIRVFSIRLIDDNIRFPGITERNIFPGLRITVHQIGRASCRERV